MTINLAGTTFLPSSTKKLLECGEIAVDSKVRVIQVNSVKMDYDADYAVLAGDDVQVGWIPQLATIKKYMANEVKQGDPEKHDMQYKRYKAAEKIRQQVSLDLHRNNIEPQGVITRLESYDGVWSISVNFAGVLA